MSLPVYLDGVMVAILITIWIIINFVINTIFHNNEYHIPSNFAEDLFEKVDGFSYCGCYGSTYLFAIIINKKVGVIDQNFNQLIAPEYKELIPPVRSTPIFVLMDENRKWGAIDAFTQKTVIGFGEYVKFWGYDHNICLACNEYEVNFNGRTNRSVIDNHGKIVIPSKEYYAIYPFYNTGVKYIIVQTSEVDTKDCMITDRKLNLLCKEDPRRWFHLDKESVEVPRDFVVSADDIDISDKMDAYEGDYDALWNTD